jgi:hypothetical protein
MKAFRLACILFVLALTPAVALAQAGITSLMTSPLALGRSDMEVRGYVTLEDDIDVFGVFRQGLGGALDYGLRAGYTSVADGGFHLGGDLRYGLSSFEGSNIRFAVVGGLQLSFADLGNIISVPAGVSIGADVGTGERNVILYGLPKVLIIRYDPEGFDSNTEVEFGLELGGEIDLTPELVFSGALTLASVDDDNIEVVLGLIYRW